MKTGGCSPAVSCGRRDWISPPRRAARAEPGNHGPSDFKRLSKKTFLFPKKELIVFERWNELIPPLSVRKTPRRNLFGYLRGSRVRGIPCSLWGVKYRMASRAVSSSGTSKERRGKLRVDYPPAKAGECRWFLPASRLRRPESPFPLQNDRGFHPNERRRMRCRYGGIRRYPAGLIPRPSSALRKTRAARK
jgi:hypothetical protein